MSNPYFTASDAIADFTRARASSVNTLATGVEAAFDLLPTPTVLGKVATPAVAAGGTANAITITNTDAISSYALGQRIAWKATATNSGATTVNVDGLGVKNILRPDGSNLVAADLFTGRVYEAIYDGTNFQLLSGILDISEEGIGSYVAAISANADAAAASAAAALVSENNAETAEINAEVAQAAAEAAAAAFTAAGLLTSIKTVDGTGSGLDADLVQGTTPGAGGLSVLAGASAAAIKTTLSLNNVDNTSDANKPVSTATQTALDLKANIAGPSFTGVVSFADGAVGAPSITNTGDTNTGLYFSAADTVDVATNGVNRLSISTTALTSTLTIIAPDGNVSTPGIRFSGDSDSGFTLTGSNEITIALGGAVGLQVRTTMIVLPQTANTPASGAASGAAGMFCWDTSYLYIATGTNTWRRVAHSTW